MRQEILKFRAWDGLNKTMSFWTMNDLCNHTDDSTEKPSPLEEWMQYTGLKDKNGKEIYEGDILDNEGARQKYEVIFHNGCFCISQGGLGYHIFNEKKVEVIGNIYENKDLLE